MAVKHQRCKNIKHVRVCHPDMAPWASNEKNVNSGKSEEKNKKKHV